MTIRECDSGVGESHYCCLEGGAGLGRGLRPSGSSQHRERARTSRRGWFGRAVKAGILGIADDPRREADCHQQGVLERGGEHTGPTLNESNLTYSTVTEI